MVNVGDAYFRTGEVRRSRIARKAGARRLRLAAFLRGLDQGFSKEALRTAKAFAALRDPEMVDQCIRVAGGLAPQAGDAHARARARAVAEPLAAQLLKPKRPRLALL